MQAPTEFQIPPPPSSLITQIQSNWSLPCLSSLLPAHINPSPNPQTWLPSILTALLNLSLLTRNCPDRARNLLKTYFLDRTREATAKGRQAGARAQLEVIDVLKASESIQRMIPGWIIEGRSEDAQWQGAKALVPDTKGWTKRKRSDGSVEAHKKRKTEEEEKEEEEEEEGETKSPVLPFDTSDLASGQVGTDEEVSPTLLSAFRPFLTLDIPETPVQTGDEVKALWRELQDTEERVRVARQKYVDATAGVVSGW
ncbi:hypothetical protein GQ44DRAFT_774647 [Phaeosphaeriaceae sp. PMI808]|nr:hypothetical protein GQ44DRAFT_774647 [Phaeosphaeriaceae sp. PMI808]